MSVMARCIIIIYIINIKFTLILSQTVLENLNPSNATSLLTTKTPASDTRTSRSPATTARPTTRPSPAANTNKPDTSGGGGLDAVEDLVQNVRLPRNVVPLHYLIEIQTIFEPDFKFQGRVEIEIGCNESTNAIILHAKGLDIEDNNFTVRLKRDPTSNLQIQQWGIAEKNDFLVIYLAEPLTKGEVYILSLSFSGALGDDLNGFFRNIYRDGNNQTNWIAATHFKAINARRAFPCFDEPGLKAIFDIVVVRPNYMISLSNSDISYREARPGGVIADYYLPTLRMSTYLVSFVVCDFRFKETRTARGVKIRAWAPVDLINEVDYVLDLAPQLITYYESYFGLLYPLTKLDIVPIPDFGTGGMENWGLITLQSGLMLFDVNLSSPNLRIVASILLAHEICHQWFGNLVTFSWWDTMWLNEGFCTYMAYRAIGLLRPEWQLEDVLLQNEFEPALIRDSSLQSYPLFIYNVDPAEVNWMTDSLSYSKATCVIRMLNTVLGERSFRTGVWRFLSQWQYSNTTQSELWSALSTASQEDGRPVNVRTMMRSWILQMGFPVVTILRNYRTGRLGFLQSHFSYPTTSNFTANNTYIRNRFKWQIPVTFITADDRNWDVYKLIWLPGSNVTMEDQIIPPNRWVVGNVKVTGFYRTNYDTFNWDMIAQQFNVSHEAIYHSNRAQLVDDAFQLARAGLLDYNRALNLTLYMRTEQIYYVWKTILNNLASLSFRLEKSCAYRLMARYILQQILPVYLNLGWNINSGERVLAQMQRQDVLGETCYLGLKDCATKAKTMFSDWIKNPTDNVISPELRNIVFCNAIRYGGEEEWNTVFKEYRRAISPNEVIMYLNALACSRDEGRLQRLLDLTLTDFIRKQDRAPVLVLVGHETRGVKLAWEFLKEKWKDIKKSYYDSGTTMDSILISLAGNFRTEDELAEFETFTQEHSNEVELDSPAFQRSLEIISQNIFWEENARKTVVEWLRQHTNGGSVCND